MKRLPWPVAAVAAIALTGGAWVAQVRTTSTGSSTPSPLEFLANGLLSASFLLLGIAVVAAAFLRGRHRAYWAGFAAFGWAYLVLLLAPWCETKIGPMLLSDVLFRQLEQEHRTQIVTQDSVISLSEQMRYAPRQIGHALAALLLGLLGGEAGWWFARPTAQQTVPSREDSSKST